MAVLDDIRSCVLRGAYLLSKHAVDQSIVRDVEPTELEEALLGSSEIIEDYPADKYGPSCLVLGYTESGRPLHIQCAYGDRSRVKIVTLYEPDPALWIDFRRRRPR